MNDPSKRIEFLQQGRDMIYQEPLAVMKERGKRTLEIFRADLAPRVFVLRNVRLGLCVPDLEPKNVKSRLSIFTLGAHLHSTYANTKSTARRPVALLALALLLGPGRVHAVLPGSHLEVKDRWILEAPCQVL